MRETERDGCSLMHSQGAESSSPRVAVCVLDEITLEET
jgi:hypothetical protein